MKKNKFSDTENIVVKSKIIERQKRAFSNLSLDEIKDENKSQYEYVQTYLHIINNLLTDFQNKKYSEFIKTYNILEKHGKISDAEKLVKKIYQHTNSMNDYKNLDSNFERENTKIYWKDQWQIPFTVRKDRNIYVLELKNFTEKERTDPHPEYFIDMTLKQYLGKELEFKNKLFIFNPLLQDMSWVNLKQTNQEIPDNSMDTILELNDVRIFTNMNTGRYTNAYNETEKYLIKKILKKYTDSEINKKVTKKIANTMIFLFSEGSNLSLKYKLENKEDTTISTPIYATEQKTNTKNDLIKRLKWLNFPIE